MCPTVNECATDKLEYIRVYGEVVIAAGTETVVWGGRMPNVGKTEHLRFTGIWMKRGGIWPGQRRVNERNWDVSTVMLAFDRESAFSHSTKLLPDNSARMTNHSSSRCK